MAGVDDVYEDDPLSGGTFSQLLFADDEPVVSLDHHPAAEQSNHHCFSFPTSTFPHSNNRHAPKMLCFDPAGCSIEKSSSLIAGQKSGLTCSDSSSASSTNNANVARPISLAKPNRKRNGSETQSEAAQPSGSGAGGAPPAMTNQRNSKKTKSENKTAGHAKVRKEKLGDRISALQQLVSPFGKTDTASVLHEAMGYIRFLQEQVQVLCSPYLQPPMPSPPHPLHLLHPNEAMENHKEDGSTKDLRSRGLCLVPVQLTLHVADSNGADFWSPATVNLNSNNGSPSR